MRIGVVGAGVVGYATARCYMEHAEVRVYDVIRERATHSLADTLESDLIMVCLPSPQRAGSLACDTSTIEDFFAALRGSRKNYVLRSTTPIGTTRALREKYDLPNLLHSPEFLTARCAVTDAQLPARNIVGISGHPLSRDWCRREDGQVDHPLVELYERRFPGAAVHVMTSDESEFVKLAQNSLFACKIALLNELYSFAEAMNLDWGRVLAGVLADGRISHSHTTIPGHHGRGFAGSCLPKDLANLIYCIERLGLNAAVTRAAHERNLEDRRR